MIRDFIRGHMPHDIREHFYNVYRVSPDELIDRVYADPMPNRYCASFTRFLGGEQVFGHDYSENVKRECFRDFFRNIIVHYPDYSAYLFNCVGSIGWVFKDTLTLIANEFGMETGKIIQSPMEGLIAYHQI
ncbi:hypothetical protein [Proteiniphilum sp. X52]|uniref:hypothetical protein n=1 Tax=Proteiniphilum sp. X52 TaxID=2382159 RepID=UPI000F0A5F99|nr:hypothetical protein [Proteiniphilum sp. X52]RNC65737.1 hypothetical protein D7D25_06220 [Proteiniphilum sp. X52]